ncbi:MAG: hypothetical protein PVG39_22145 [Desulfobacteraceae bacterium]|jgi:hypothetical protein
MAYESLAEQIIKDTFYVLVSLGSCAWIHKWWISRILTKYFIAENIATDNIESLYRRISGLLRLDMTYLLKPEYSDEHLRSHSFESQGFFKRVRDENVEEYKFIFFEKINTDRTITTIINVPNKRITLETNLQSKDIKKLKKLFSNGGYKLNKLNQISHEAEYKELENNL